MTLLSFGKAITTERLGIQSDYIKVHKFMHSLEEYQARGARVLGKPIDFRLACLQIRNFTYLLLEYILYLLPYSLSYIGKYTYNKLEDWNKLYWEDDPIIINNILVTVRIYILSGSKWLKLKKYAKFCNSNVIKFMRKDIKRISRINLTLLSEWSRKLAFLLNLNNVIANK